VNKGLLSLWGMTAGQRWRLCGVMIALIGATLLGYLIPLIVKVAIDGVVADEQASVPTWAASWLEAMGGRSVLAQRLWFAGLAVILITALAGVFTYLRGRWAARSSEAIARRLREDLYNRLHHVPIRFYDRVETGDLVQRCTSDVETLRLFMSTQSLELVRAVLMLAVAIPIMLALDVRMTLAATCILPVIVLFAVFFFRRVKDAFEAMDSAEGAMSSSLQENLTGIRVVRAFARQEHEIDRFGYRNNDHRRKHLKLYALMAVYWASSDLLVFAQMGVVLFTGAWLVLKGAAGGGISVGTMVAFWSYVGLYIWPVRQMGRILSDLGKAMVAVDRVQMILHTEPEADAEDVLPLERLPREVDGGIAFDRVSFAHGEEVPVLHDVSFEIKAGETLAILGPSGSGKSTLVNLLLRLYDQDSGSITLDGTELRRYPRQHLRRQFGVVMQEPFLYSKTIRDNVRLGVPPGGSGTREIGDEQMIQAAADASVHDAITRFSAGYETLTGERGVALSGGQRQRVALARVLLQEPPVLILDDAFSAVDTGTERSILSAIEARQARRTTILIAHRVSTLMQADRVLVLEDGRVTALGTHAELIGREGLYSTLWDMQRAGLVDAEQVAGATAHVNHLDQNEP